GPANMPGVSVSLDPANSLDVLISLGHANTPGVSVSLGPATPVLVHRRIRENVPDGHTTNHENDRQDPAGIKIRRSIPTANRLRESTSLLLLFERLSSSLLCTSLDLAASAMPVAKSRISIKFRLSLESQCTLSAGRMPQKVQ